MWSASVSITKQVLQIACNTISVLSKNQNCLFALSILFFKINLSFLFLEVCSPGKTEAAAYKSN